ncbi:MAG: acetylornithine carbamoyltransferase [Ferruginibacter sp.]
MKQFVSVQDVTDLDGLVVKALAYKANPLLDFGMAKGKSIGLLFLNPSMRTRISTQVAAQNLGMEAIVFNVDKDGWALEFGDGAIMNGTTVEHVKDAAPIMGEYFDILCLRTFPSLQNRDADYAETILNSFIKYSGIPVVSLESATLHPLQSLTDIITMEESMKVSGIKRPKVVLTWAPHIKPLPQCVANSFAQWVGAWGKADFVIAHPQGYALPEKFTGSAVITYDQQEALKDADFVYVKNWSSYEDYGAMPEVDDNWMLDNRKLQLTNDAKIMHCLPVRRNVELSDEALDGPNSLVSTQGGNRIWAAQAVIAEVLKR